MSTRSIVLFILSVIIFWETIFNVAAAAVQSDEDDQSEEIITTTMLATTEMFNASSTKRLSRIETLDGHCEEKTCRNFHFDRDDQVAFFDLKSEVRINEESTYDIISPMAYDTMIFENSTFKHFPLHLFYEIRIKELDMRNCAIEFITWENFLMAENLQILLLSNNLIEKIDEMTFNYAYELQYIFLDSNRIRRLVNESFKGLTELRYLDLQHNQLEELPIEIFRNLPALQEVRLNHNQLHTIGNEIFRYNSHLITISLNDNHLRELGEYAFRSARKLLLLDISGNAELRELIINLQVRNLMASECSLNRVNVYGAVEMVDMCHNQIMELYFSQPETLAYLSLRNNALQQIASLALATNLRTLDLADNPELRNLPEPLQLKLLERLDLSNTSLSVLPIASLAEQTNLRSLNVSQNKLQEINPLNFQYLKHITHFYIHANDWNCYNLQLLMDLLIRPNNIIYTHDRYDPQFPGEYIFGIACMYRVAEYSDADDQIKSDTTTKTTTTATTSETNQMIMGNYAEQLRSHNEPAANVPNVEEVEQLRREMKTIVQFYEEKFHKVFEMINRLNERLENFERLNATMWQYVTITT